MKYSKEIITTAIDLYFKGLSLRKITDYVYQFHSQKVHASTVLRWVRKYVRQIKKYTDSFVIKNSKTWHVDETVIRLSGKMAWVWNLMDKETRFFLATAISTDRNLVHCIELLKDAKRMAYSPELFVSDGLQTYSSAYGKVFDTSKVKHSRLNTFKDKINNNIVERLHCTVKDRIKPMHKLYSFNTARTYFNGFLIYYNFIKPHESLNGKTPAQEAKLNINLDRNKWLSLIEKSDEW